MLSFKHALSVEQTSRGDEKQRKCTVVGVEKDGIVLVARDDFDEKGCYRTCLDIYDMRTSGRRPKSEYVGSKEAPTRIMAASVNVDKSLIAYTTQKEKKRNNDPVTEYDCSIGRGGKFYAIKSPPTARQQFSRVQFVHFDIKSSKSAYLHMIDKERIDLFSITQDSKKALTGQADRIYGIAEQHIWSQFMPHNNTLYVLGIKQKKQGDVECSLKCYGFRGVGHKPDILEEHIFKMKLSPSSLSLPSLYYNQPWVNGGANPDRTLKLQIVNAVEKRRKGDDRHQILVLTHQQLDNSSPHMKLGIYCLITRHHMNLTIKPAASLPPVCPCTPIFVGALKKRILVVYLPGYFTYLIDVQHKGRPPKILLSTVDPDMTLPPSQQDTESDMLTPQALQQLERTPPIDFDACDGMSFETSTYGSPRTNMGIAPLGSRAGSSPTSSTPATPLPSRMVPPPQSPAFTSSTQNSPAPQPSSAPVAVNTQLNPTSPLVASVITTQGLMLVDLHTCTFYTYSLNEEMFKTWFLKRTDAANLPLMMHFLLSHLPDLSSLGLTPLGVVKSLPPTMLTPNFFKEYLLGVSYARMRDYYKGDSDGMDLVDLMPKSILGTTSGVAEGCKMGASRQAFSLITGLERTLQLPVGINWEGVGEHQVVNGKALDTASSNGSQQSSGFFASIKDKLSGGNSNAGKGCMRLEKSVQDAMMTALTDGLTEQLMRGGSRMEAKGDPTPQLWNPVPRNKAVAFVKEYKEELKKMVKELVTVLVKTFQYTSGGQEAYDAYSVLLAVTVALEELSMPRPDILNTEFTIAAYHANSRKGFLQLVKRGGVHLSADLIDTLRGEDIKLQPVRGKNLPEADQAFFFQLILMLDTMERRIDRVEVDELCEHFLLQYYQAQMGKDKPKKGSKNLYSTTAQPKQEDSDPTTNFMPFETLRPGWDSSHAGLYLQSHAAEFMAKEMSPLISVRKGKSGENGN
eukprot:TRINITY_DN18323_c0_g1_i1.p1 TRINITY_DN18323_c0_g1~~TRINITY_DN18323_c0_g1_i1.p1  ORF type:complete len:966 (+),score=208.98 TRINITY_DN18323_c0_g1_i1:47-2944(+)